MIDRTARVRLRVASIGVIAGIVLPAAACSNDDEVGDDADVRPFAEVQADEFVFEADPTNPERAIFRVTTTEPMICAIVWGETEELGNLNNSLAMNGTGIIDHDVFRSDTATFTIPESAASPPVDDVERGDNLALDATVIDASSQFSDGFAAANAIDDSGTTEWSSAGDGDDAFITLDLGEDREIAGVEFITRSMLDGTAITETFTVTVDDGDTFGPFPAGTPAEPNFAPVEASGRVVRFDVERSTGGNVGAVEVRVLAP